MLRVPVKWGMSSTSTREKKGKWGKSLLSQMLFSGYRGGGVEEGKVGRKMNVHLCGLWPDFGNESRFCHVSVDWQSLQENGVQQVKGILKSLRDDAQQSHRSLQQQTAWLKGWEPEGIPNKTAFPFPKPLIYWDHRILMSYQPSRNESRELQCYSQDSRLSLPHLIQPITRAQLTGDTEICNEKIL